MAPLRNISLKLSLIGAICLFSALTLITVLIVADRSTSQYLVQYASHKVQRDMMILQQQLADDIMFNDWDAVARDFEAYASSEEITRLTLLSDDLKTVLTPGLALTGQSAGQIDDHYFNPPVAANSLQGNSLTLDIKPKEAYIGAYLPLEIPSYHNQDLDMRQALIYMHHDLQPALSRARHELRQTGLLFTAVGSLGLLGMLLFFRHHVTNPLQFLAAASEKMASGHYSLRLPVKGNNEIGRLEAALNRFASSSEEYINKLKGQHQRLHELANYDELTQLPNRRLLHEQLEAALASTAQKRQRGALMFIDLDFFKDVNDSLGHQTGDLLLFQVAERLKHYIRQEDTLARIGGDEFVLLTAHLPGEQQAAVDSMTHLGERILEAISNPFRVNGHKFHLTASAGISFFPNNADTLQDLLRQADTAMYRAKAAGRGRLCFFSPEMQQRANERLNLRNQLQQAIEEQQFELFMQPQVDVRTGEIRGAECLIRWQHPTEGIISPADFIPIAEESGLIIDIGNWVIATACEQLQMLEQQADGQQVKQLSVNISPRQFHSAGFVDQVKTLVETYDIDPQKLCFELTENLLVDSLVSAIEIATDLKALGISFSIDDFGTGYSSLSYLTQLPLDELKIDKSFINQVPENQRGTTVVDTIVAMAHQMGAQVVAEGVENQKQLQYLQRKQCELFQGYFAYKPMPFKQLLVLLDEKQEPAFVH